jgi:hypothetical protein
MYAESILHMQVIIIEIYTSTLKRHAMIAIQAASIENRQVVVLFSYLLSGSLKNMALVHVGSFMISVTLSSDAYAVNVGIELL